MSLYWTAYKQLASDGTNRVLPAPQEPALAAGVLDLGPEPAVSDPWPPGTAFVCLVAIEDCFVAFGQEPKAVADRCPIMAGERLFFGVHPGQRIAAIWSHHS